MTNKDGGFMNKEQMAEQAFYAQLSYKGAHKDSFVNGYMKALEHQEARVKELEAENERLREALLDIKNGKDNPCYLADEALLGEE